MTNSHTSSRLARPIGLAALLAAAAANVVQGQYSCGLYTPSTKTIASDAALGDEFGTSVAVSGNFAIVGSPYDDHAAGENAGSAYIYARNLDGPGTWGQVKKLIASDAQASSNFGTSVAISGDIAVVGSPNTSVPAVYVFSRNLGGTNNWGQVKKVTPTGAVTFSSFGWSVALRGDTLVVGAKNDGPPTSSGSAFVFYRNQGGTDNWGQVRRVVASDAASSDEFGSSIALSGDDMVVGAPLDNAGDGFVDHGSSYVFSRNQGGANNWGQVRKLTASDAAPSDWFGDGVAVSGDSIIVGSPQDDPGGSAYVYSRNQGGANNWGQIKKIDHADIGNADRFGDAVAITGDVAVVGSSNDESAGFGFGSAYVFDRTQGGTNNWGQVIEIAAFDGANLDRFGTSVAIDGDTVTVGSPFDNHPENSFHEGSAYIFDLADRRCCFPGSDELFVPSAAYPTIQAALDDACNDDTVVLTAALYTGPGNVNLDFGGKPISLHSQMYDPDLCVIDCENTPNTRGITFIGAPAGTSVSGITFRNGNAPNGGGMLIAGGSVVTLGEVNFENNVAPDTNGGGALYVVDPGSSVAAYGCNFSGNHANGGGAAYVVFGGDATFEGSTFIDNTANFAGAAVLGQELADVTNVTIINCLFRGNESLAGGWGAVSSQYGNTMTVTNCTFVENLRGLDTSDGGTTTATNCIFWGNTLSQVTSFPINATTLTYSAVQGGWAGPGPGNIADDPMFADAAGGDFSLLPGSPCRDAGNDLVVPPIGDPDLAGNSRFRDGACSIDSPGICPLGNPALAARVDMGALEAPPWSGIAPGEFDCNVNLIPDHCEAECAIATASTITDPVLSQDFRTGVLLTYQSMLAAYGRPWAPNTSQDPADEVDPNDPANPDYSDEPARILLALAAEELCDPAIDRILREVADMHLLQGNEAFSDALDSTVGEGDGNGTIDINGFGTFFAFKGVAGIATPIDEELALLRGREIALPFNDAVNYPGYGGFRAAIYNRLPPNAEGTDPNGNLAYRSAYGGLSGGILNNHDAVLAYPQGHGDAYGYYLGAITTFVSAFGHPAAAAYLIPRQPADDTEDVESGSRGTVALPYRSVREMSAAMAARARAASSIVDLTFRKNYQAAVDPSSQIAEYNPAAPQAGNSARSWRTADWASRAGLGAYLDWALVNHLLPARDPDAPDDIGLDASDANRQDLDEIDTLTGAVKEMQARVDRAAAGADPLGLARNGVPFSISAGSLASFIDDPQANPGGDHYQQVRAPAVAALDNAGLVLAWANQASQRMRAAAESQSDFTQWSADAEIDFTNRLIGIFGLPSPTDPADNDLNGVFDEDEDEAGITLGVPGGPDLVNFILDEDEMEAAAQAAGIPFTPRTAPGELQLARSELNIAQLALQKALAAVTALDENIRQLTDDIERRRINNGQVISIIWSAGNQQMDLVERQREIKLASLQTDGWDIGLGIVGDIVGGVAGCFGDVSGPQCAGKLIATGISSAISVGNEERKKASERERLRPGGDDDEFDVAREQTRVNQWKDASLAGIEGDNAVMDMKRELQALIRESPQRMIEIATAREQVRQAQGRWAASYQEGQRLLADRERMRKVARDQLEAYRWKDLAFRVFRNDALQKYRGFRDLAERYVTLAARAYAYEYNRSDSDLIFAQLYTSRLLGATGSGAGLWGIINGLDQAWIVNSAQWQFNVPPVVTRSLRQNLLGLNPSTSDQEANLAFRSWLESQIVQKLEQTIEMARFAGPTTGLDQGPAIALRLSTQISPGYNFFGKPIGAGSPYGLSVDFAPTWQTYMMLRYEVLFENAQLEVLGGGGTKDTLTMWVMPVGDSVFRDDTSNVPGCNLVECKRLRPWAVFNQKLDAPSGILPDGAWETDPTYDAWLDTAIVDIQDDNFGIQTFASSTGEDTPGAALNSDRAGRALWNTNWFMAVPGGQFAGANTPDDLRRQMLLTLIWGDDPGLPGLQPNPPNGNPATGITDIKWVIHSYRRQGF